MAIYTQPSITGYNASPPPDDGSSTSANELTWAKHKDKLADPIKTYAEAVDANVLAAFDRIPFIKVSAKTGDYTLVNTDRGTLLSVTNTTTITLLPSATAGLGWSIAIQNLDSGVTTITIDGNASETINGAATVALLPGESIILVADGTNWDAQLLTDGTQTPFPSGTLMLFQQTSAPVGWTKEVTHDDKALRVVTGSASSGGNDAFTTIFGASIATNSHALATSEIPSHSHTYSNTNTFTGSYAGPLTLIDGITGSGTSTGSTGGGGGHTHDLSNDLQYVDVIIASKD